MGHRPWQETSDFIEWDRRALNTYADHAANVALDIGSSWAVNQAGIDRACSSKANLCISVDGACREGGCSAGGMAVWAYHEDGSRELLHRAGSLFDGVHSAILSEILALEWALEVLFTVALDCTCGS